MKYFILCIALIALALLASAQSVPRPSMSTSRNGGSNRRVDGRVDRLDDKVAAAKAAAWEKQREERRKRVVVPPLDYQEKCRANGGVAHRSFGRSCSFTAAKGRNYERRILKPIYAPNGNPNAVDRTTKYDFICCAPPTGQYEERLVAFEKKCKGTNMLNSGWMALNGCAGQSQRSLKGTLEWGIDRIFCCYKNAFDSMGDSIQSYFGYSSTSVFEQRCATNNGRIEEVNAIHKSTPFRDLKCNDGSSPYSVTRSGFSSRVMCCRNSK